MPKHKFDTKLRSVRMSPNWAEIVLATATSLGCVIAGVGILLVLRQIQQVEITVRGDTHAKLIGNSFDVLRFLAENPETYDYFYSGVQLKEGDKNRVQVLCATEMMANYIEHVALQEPYLSRDEWKNWQNFIEDTFRSSPSLQNHIDTNTRWYAKFLRDIVDGVPRERPRPSRP